MSKFFVNKNEISNGKIYITGENYNHMKNALRVKENEKINICNIDTKENYICKIDEISKNKIDCTILSKKIESNEPNVFLEVFQGLPKADKMEWIIEKCTEIGVSKFTPVEMERCVVKIDEKSKPKKVLRWQKIAEASAMQSERDIIPEVNNILKYSEIFNLKDDYDLIILAYENEKEKTLKEEIKKIDKKENLKIAIIIGPEGGISENELSLACKNNVSIVTLGRRILRTETAPIYMSSSIIYDLDA